MSKNKANRNNLAFLSFIGILVFTTIFGSISMPVHSEEIVSDGNDETGPTPRIPDFSVSASSTLTHNHRGDTLVQGQCFNIPVIHEHSGNETEGGGCFTPVYHVHGGGCYISGTCAVNTRSHEIYDYKTINCSYHGATTAVKYNVLVNHSSCGLGNQTERQGGNCIQCGHNVYSYTHQYSQLVCSLPGDYIDYYANTCGMTEGEDIDHYDPDCGLEEIDYGSITLYNATPEWTAGNVTLIGLISDPQGAISAGGYGVLSYTNISGEISDYPSDGIEVSENGVYCMNVSIDDALFDSAASQVMLTVGNIDRTPPRINSISYDTGEQWLHVNTITVDALDVQPDETPGSGIADFGYSFDGGNTWQSSNSYDCIQNGTYTIQVKDYCGNISSEIVEVTNIDNDGPAISYSYSPSTWYDNDSPRTFVFAVSDDKSGLPEEPISYDAETTWTAMNVTFRHSAGMFSIAARDNLGNISYLNVANDYTKRPVYYPEDNPDEEDDTAIYPPDDDDSDETDEDDDEDDDDPSRRRRGRRRNGSGDDGDNDGSGENEFPDGDGTYDESSANGLDSNDTLEKIVYFEEIPTSGSPFGGGDTGRTSHIPFYKSSGFKVIATVGSGTVAGSSVIFLLLFLFSGAVVLSFDGNRYRLISFIPIHRSARGYYINIKAPLQERSYSSKYKFILGWWFVKRHKDDLMYVRTDTDWIEIEINKSTVFTLTDS